MKNQLVLQVFYSVLSVYILNVLRLWEINFYMSFFDWLRINNKCGFQLANRFPQRKFFIFLITNFLNIVKLEPMNLPRFPSFFLPNPWCSHTIFIWLSSTKKQLLQKFYFDFLHVLNFACTSDKETSSCR